MEVMLQALVAGGQAGTASTRQIFERLPVRSCYMLLHGRLQSYTAGYTYDRGRVKRGPIARVRPRTGWRPCCCNSRATRRVPILAGIFHLDVDMPRAESRTMLRCERRGISGMRDPEPQRVADASWRLSRRLL